MIDASEIETLRPLAGGGGNASVELVRAAGRLWVLKRHRPRDLAAERLFHGVLRKHGLPSLGVEECRGLQPDQLLLEYVPGSPTIGGSPSFELCRRFGEAIGGLHRVRSIEFQILDDQGVVASANWQDFLASLVREAIDRQRSRDTGLPARLLNLAEIHLASLSSFAPSEFVLTHGDLHVNNALVRGEEIVLFDKPAGVWLAPAMFDLCLIFSEAFPGARYGADRRGRGSAQCISRRLWRRPA